MSLYTNLSSSPEEGHDPAVTHSMSQDRADLVRQSSGSLYGQVYDVFLGETATGNIVWSYEGIAVYIVSFIVYCNASYTYPLKYLL